MLGVEHQGGLEGADLERLRLAPGDHRQEARGVPQLRPRRRRPLSLAHAVVRRGDRGHLGDQADCLPPVGFRGIVLGVGVERPQERDARLEHAHRRHLARQELEGLEHRRMERARLGQLLAEAVQLPGARQLAVPQEPHHLLERRPPGQVLDVVALVGEAALLAVKVAQARGGGHDALEALDDRGVGRHRTAPPGVGCPCDTRRRPARSSAPGAAARRDTAGRGGPRARGYAPTMTSTTFCSWLMSIGLLIIVNGPISSALAMRSESG